MKKILFMGLSLLFLLNAQAGERSLLTTYGEGVYEAAPDTVVINLAVQREGLTAADAQDALRKALASVLEALKPLDIPNENIKTDGYSLYPLYKQRKDAGGGNYETEEIDRYRTYIRLSIEVYQIPQVGRIADTAIKAGVNRVENITFTLKDQEAAKTEAVKLAVDNAQGKARLLADRFNVRLLSPVVINETTDFRAPALRNTSMIMAEADRAGFNLPEGKLQIRSRIDVSYETAPASPQTVTPSALPRPAPPPGGGIALP
jgi:uncharacterized protein YggE